MDLQTHGFRRTRPGTESYDMDEVDRFVAEVREALAHRPPTMAPWEVRDKVFKTQRVHRGYDEHDVDDFLDRAEQALREAHGETLDEPPPDELTMRSRPILLAALLLLVVVAAAVVTVLTMR